ncbi:hypothetical protein Agub_g5637, partial [Astrephomene gubernaculifera]
GGALMRQNARLRAAAAATSSTASATTAAAVADLSSSSSSSGGHVESALSRAVLESHEEGMQEVLHALLGCWRAPWSGSALRADLGAPACTRLRSWLVSHAGVTLWPAVKELTQIAYSSGTCSAGPPWLSAPLVDLLIQLCRDVGGAQWRAAAATTTAAAATTTAAAATTTAAAATTTAAAATPTAAKASAAARVGPTTASSSATCSDTPGHMSADEGAAAAATAASPWRGPPGTYPLPRLAVWALVSNAVVTSTAAASTATAAAAAAAVSGTRASSSGSAPPPSFLTPAMLQELLA